MRRVGFALPVVLGIAAAVGAGACSAGESSVFSGDGAGGSGAGAGGSGTTTGGTGGAGGAGTGGATTTTSAGGAGTGGAATTSAGGSGGATTTSAGGAGTGGSGGATTTTTAPKPDGGVDPCSDASKLVYVFTNGNAIYSFDPPNKKFTFVASPDCQAIGSPNSMAIDRNLVAWINYIGEIQTFDLKKKSGCTPSGVNLPVGFGQVGMGFSTDQPGGVAETLFVDSISGGGLASIKNGALTPIGPFSGDPALLGGVAELTGTGDARLFGYFTTSPWVRVAEIEKASGKILSDHELTGVSPPSSWAWSFWGGAFYLYAAPGNNGSGNSTVVRYDPVTQAVDPAYVPDAGFTIVGAGVSTCAPLHQ